MSCHKTIKPTKSYIIFLYMGNNSCIKRANVRHPKVYMMYTRHQKPKKKRDTHKTKIFLFWK